MKKYPIVCPSCRGTGWIQKIALSGFTGNLDTVCPACKGSGVVSCEDNGDEKKEGI